MTLTQPAERRTSLDAAGRLVGHDNGAEYVPAIMSTSELPLRGERAASKWHSWQRAESSEVTWRWWAQGAVAVVLIACLVGALVYVISDQFPASYQSSALVRVSVQATSGISDPAVTAANDLASQEAQLASTAPVSEAAASYLGVPSKELAGSLSAGTVAAQNLVRVSVTAPTPAQAQARATAASIAFVTYIDRLDTEQAHAYEHAITSRLGPLRREIAAARQRLSSANGESQRNATVLLSGLLGQEQTVVSGLAQSVAVAQPRLQAVAPGGAASKTSPKPRLYGAVGFLATLLLLGRLLYVVGVRRLAFRETTL